MPLDTENKPAVAIEVRVTSEELHARHDDGRTIATPIAWYPRLLHGTEEQRQNVKLIDGGRGMHWPDLDEVLSIEGMLAGHPSSEGSESLARWRRSREER